MPAAIRLFRWITRLFGFELRVLNKRNTSPAINVLLQECTLYSQSWASRNSSPRFRKYDRGVLGNLNSFPIVKRFFVFNFTIF